LQLADGLLAGGEFHLQRGVIQVARCQFVRHALQGARVEKLGSEDGEFVCCAQQFARQLIGLCDGGVAGLVGVLPQLDLAGKLGLGGLELRLQDGDREKGEPFGWLSASRGSRFFNMVNMVGISCRDCDLSGGIAGGVVWAGGRSGAEARIAVLGFQFSLCCVQVLLRAFLIVDSVFH